jgi:hypothetical protein
MRQGDMMRHCEFPIPRGGMQMNDDSHTCTCAGELVSELARNAGWG